MDKQHLNSTARILLVEDDEQIAESVVDWLEMEKYHVDLAVRGEHALCLMEQWAYDLLLLDWGLPDMTGSEVLKRYRAQGGEAPVIFLTGKYDLKAAAAGLHDDNDIVNKPCDLRGISALMRRKLRQTAASSSSSTVVVGEAQLDLDTRKLILGAKSISLTNKECTVLEFLMRHPDQELDVQVVLLAMRANDSELSENAVRACMKNLFRKLKAAGENSVVKSFESKGVMNGF